MGNTQPETLLEAGLPANPKMGVAHGAKDRKAGALPWRTGAP